MIRRVNGRRPWLLAFAAVAALAIALPAAAQSTGLVKGVVKDDKGQPVDGAKITIEFQDGVNRKFDGKSDKKGEFLQIGLPPGSYKITAEKDKLSAAQIVRVRIGQTAETSLVLGAAAAGGNAEAAKKSAELKKAFDEGVEASHAGRQDDAVAAFTRAAEVNPTCYDCYYNIGFAESQKKDYEKAEASYKKAIELKPDYAEAYTGLANVYNAQRKFDEASAASAKANELGGGAAAGAAGGGNAGRTVQSGRHPLERGKSGRREEAVRGRRRRESESRGSALSARNGARERGQHGGRRHGVRNVSEARSRWTECRASESACRPTEKIVIDAVSLRARLADVRDRIARAADRAGRDPAGVRLIAVSKTFDAEHVRATADAGQVDFGENKVQEALLKMDLTKDLSIRWHLIGHLQSNKAKKAGATVRRRPLGRWRRSRT